MRRWLTLTFGLTVMGCLLQASTITLTNIDSSWINPTPVVQPGLSITNVAGGGTDVIAWGTNGTGGDQSQYQFTPSAVPLVAGDPAVLNPTPLFVLGNFNHHNVQIDGPFLTQVFLNLNLGLTIGATPVVVSGLEFEFIHDETDNTNYPICCDDHVTIASVPGDTSFNVNGITYTLSLFFGDTATPPNPVSTLSTHEGQDNPAAVYGQISATSSSVPEPQTFMLVGLGILALSFTRLRRGRHANS